MSLTEAIASGYAEGHAEGHAEGYIAAKKDMIQKKLAKGKTVEEIADDLEEELAVIEKLIEELKNN